MRRCPEGFYFEDFKHTIGIHHTHSLGYGMSTSLITDADDYEPPDGGAKNSNSSANRDPRSKGSNDWHNPIVAGLEPVGA